jgi:hypothetical protein
LEDSIVNESASKGATENYDKQIARGLKAAWNDNKKSNITEEDCGRYHSENIRR